MAILYETAGFCCTKIALLYREPTATVETMLLAQNARGGRDKDNRKLDPAVTIDRLYGIGLTLAQVGKLLGEKEDKILRTMEIACIPRRSRAPQPRGQVEGPRMASWYEENEMTIQEIANLADASYYTTRNILLSEGVKLRPPGNRATNGRKIERTQFLPPGERRRAAEIRILYDSAGYCLTKLSMLYGEPITVIHGILLRQNATIKKRDRRRRIQPVQVTMERLYGLGLSLDRTGQLLGYSEWQTLKRLQAAGIPRRPRGNRARGQVDKHRMAQLYEQGLSIEEVATATGTSYYTARNALISEGVTLRPQKRRPARRGPLLLPITPGDAAQEIRTLSKISEERRYERIRISGAHLRRSRPPLDLDPVTLSTVYRATRSASATAQVLHCSTNTVINHLRRLDEPIQPRGGRRAPTLDTPPIWVPEVAPWELQNQMILRCHRQGKSTSWIASRTGKTWYEIQQILRAYGNDASGATVIRRWEMGENAALISVRTGIRIDRVHEMLRAHGVNVRYGASGYSYLRQFTPDVLKAISFTGGTGPRGLGDDRLGDRAGVGEEPVETAQAQGVVDVDGPGHGLREGATATRGELDERVRGVLIWR
ncbi:hypothetical protein [Streptomyces sp. TE33382]